MLGELDAAFARDPGSVEFYIPQLVTFLLYGAFWSSGSLQAFLLDKCGRSVQFAHRLYWYLHAACLHGSSGINPAGVRQLTALIEDVKARGQRAAARLEEGRTPQELHPPGHHHHHHHHHCHNHKHWGRGTTGSKEEGAGSRSSADDDGGGFSKEMQPRGSLGAGGSLSTNRSSSLGVGLGADGTYIDVAGLQQPPPPPPLTPPPVGNERVAITAGGGSSSVPTSPSRTRPMTAAARFPLELGAYRGADGDGDVFGVLPALVGALTALSRDLMLVGREKRTATLRAGLQDLGAQFLPSNACYMPVGNPYHRVWRVHALESFAFSTKERVPCLVCFEVVDYARLPRRSKGGKHGAGARWWSAMGMQENPLPAISHTFKFGNKEWTLKIGEPKEGGAAGGVDGAAQAGGGGKGEEGEEEDEEEEDRDDGGRDAAAAGAGSVTASLLGAQQLGASSSSSAAMTTATPTALVGAATSPSDSAAAGLHSPLRRLTSSGGPGTIDGSASGGMGQWASSSTQQQQGPGAPGLPHLVLGIAAAAASEDKEPAGGAASASAAESRDDYGTFSPPAANSPVGGHQQQQHPPLVLPPMADECAGALVLEEEEEEEAKTAAGATTTAAAAATVAPSTPRAGGGTRTRPRPPRRCRPRRPRRRRPSSSRSGGSRRSSASARDRRSGTSRGGASSP